MSDYKMRYLELFQSMTDAIELLKKAQIEAEERIIEGEDERKLITLPYAEGKMSRRGV